MNNFKSRIKELRLANNLTYSQLASMYGKSEGAIRAWETGRTNPDFDTIISLAKKFKVSIDYLLGASDTKKPENEDISKRLGLSETSIKLLEGKYRVDKKNSLTLTINTLLENQCLLHLLSQYLYYELDKETDAAERIYCAEYKYQVNGGFHYVDNTDDIQYHEPDFVDILNDEKFKKIVMLEIMEALTELLEEENKKEHFAD